MTIDHPTKFSGQRHCGSGDIMASFYHVISQDHVIKVHVSLSMGPLMLPHHPANFGGHRDCDIGNVFLGRRARHCMLASIHHYYLSLKQVSYHAITHGTLKHKHSYLPLRPLSASSTCQMCLQQQLTGHTL